MGFEKNLFYYLSGLGTLPQDAPFSISMENGFLLLNHQKVRVLGPNKTLQQYKINAGDIIAMDIVNTADLKNKSVVGRGVAGGLLFGPVGALIGGMSGAAQNKIKGVLTISFFSSANGEIKSICLNADPPSWGGLNRRAVAKIRSILDKTPKSPAVVAYLGQTRNEDGSITL